MIDKSKALKSRELAQQCFLADSAWLSSGSSHMEFLWINSCMFQEARNKFNCTKQEQNTSVIMLFHSTIFFFFFFLFCFFHHHDELFFYIFLLFLSFLYSVNSLAKGLLVETYEDPPIQMFLNRICDECRPAPFTIRVPNRDRRLHLYT